MSPLRPERGRPNAGRPGAARWRTTVLTALAAALHLCWPGTGGPLSSSSHTPGVGASAQALRGLDAFASRCFYAESPSGPSGPPGGPQAWSYTCCFRDPGVGECWRQPVTSGDFSSDYFILGRAQYPGYGASFPISGGDICPSTGRPSGGTVLALCDRTATAGRNETFAVRQAEACFAEFVITSSASCDLPAEPGRPPPAAQRGERPLQFTRVGVAVTCLAAAIVVGCCLLCYCARLKQGGAEVRFCFAPGLLPEQRMSPSDSALGLAAGSMMTAFPTLRSAGAARSRHRDGVPHTAAIAAAAAAAAGAGSAAGVNPNHPRLPGVAASGW